MALPQWLANEIRANVINYDEEMRVEIREPETAVIIRGKEHFDDRDLEFLIAQAKSYSHYVGVDDKYDGFVKFVIW